MPKNIDKYLILISIIAFAYFSMWVYYGIHKYQTYNEGYYDIGVYSYSLYWHIHYAQGVGPLVYISTFANHVSVFLLLVTSIFYFYQNPIILYIIQDFFLAFTTIMICAVTLSITDNKKLGFAMAIAFLVNPAIRGLTISNSHYEAFIPFFYILAFYCYVKNKRALFVVSLLLLLSIMETTFAIVLPLLLALLIYELVHNRGISSKKLLKSRLTLIAIGFILTILFTTFYLVTITKVISDYQGMPYSTVPPMIRTLNYISIGSTSGIANVPLPEVAIYLFILGIIFLFFGFGISSLADPLIALVLFSPWLYEIFIAHDVFFVSQSGQYYAYFIGASYVAAMLGYLIISDKGKMFGVIHINRKNILLSASFIITFAIIISSYMLLLTTLPLLIVPSGLNYTQINYAVSLIPRNATIMAQLNIAPHLYFVKNLELPPSDNPLIIWKGNLTIFWFKPEYIIIDNNLMGYTELTGQFNIYNYTKGNYTIYYNKSGITIFKVIN